MFSCVETAHEWRESIIESGLQYIRSGAWVKVDPMPQITGDRVDCEILLPYGSAYDETRRIAKHCMRL